MELKESYEVVREELNNEIPNVLIGSFVTCS